MNSGFYIAQGKKAFPSKTLPNINAPASPAVSVVFKFFADDMSDQEIEWQGSIGSERTRKGLKVKDLTLQTMRICGWDGTSDLSTCCRNKVELVIELGEKSGKPYVKYVNPLTRQELEGAEKDAFFAELLAPAERQPGEDFEEKLPW